MTDLQPGDRCLVTDPRAGKLYGEECELIRVEDGTAHLAYQGSRRSLPARWIAPVDLISGEGDRALSESLNGKATHDQARTITLLPQTQASKPLEPSITDSNARSAAHDQKPPKIDRALPPDPNPKTTHWVQAYQNRAGTYYRYCYLEGESFRPRRTHIPGGNYRAAIARQRKAMLDLAIAEGRSIAECLKLIESWRF
ncbi:MAG: hypothetical protein ONB55_22560 [candidate division KSB1 bacterium]|nr:hypothetical protein [candidate division KSB1 bacterium]